MSQFSYGCKLPAVEISQKGEVQLEGGKISYTNWSTAQLTGKVRTVFHLAGRSAAKEINEALVNALKQADLPKDSYQTTTIVNTGDALFGTVSIVAMMVEGGKKEFPWSSVVVDAKSVAQQAWNLKKESSAVFVLDTSGTLLFTKDGRLTDAEVSAVLALIESALATETA
jgi:YtfJ family uncharacterized protein